MRMRNQSIDPAAASAMEAFMPSSRRRSEQGTTSPLPDTRDLQRPDGSPMTVPRGALLAHEICSLCRDP